LQQRNSHLREDTLKPEVQRYKIQDDPQKDDPRD